MIRPLGLACAVLVALTAARADPVRLDIPEARRMAAQYLIAGRADLAETLAQGLLLKDPADVSALVTLSRAQRMQGRNADAVTSGRAAWAAAKTEREQFFAAQAMAQALSASGHRTRAQLWLRRAAEVAPDEALKATAVRDFRHVRGRNPLSTSFSFGITPSDNLNNRPTMESFDFGGFAIPLTGAARALSGVVYSAGAQTIWRHTLSETTQLRFGAQADLSRVRLSSEARAQAPTARDTDFATNAIALSFGLTRRQESGPLSLDLSVGKRWYGGDALARTDRLTLTKSLAAGPKGLLRFSGYAEQQKRLDTPLGSSDTLGGSVLWSRALDGGARLTLHAAVADVGSASHQVDHHSHGLGLRYTLGTPLAGAEVTFSGDVTWRDYQQINPTFGVYRADTAMDLEVSLFFPKAQLYGFAPVMDLTARRTDSSIAPFNTQELNISFGLRSAF